MSRLRFEHPTFRLRGVRSYPLRHRCGSRAVTTCFYDLGFVAALIQTPNLPLMVWTLLPTGPPLLHSEASAWLNFLWLIDWIDIYAVSAIRRRLLVKCEQFWNFQVSLSALTSHQTAVKRLFACQGGCYPWHGTPFHVPPDVYTYKIRERLR